nr:MAG TPA: DNA packaging protein gp3 [Caudoviricetes sp.]
MMTPRYKTVEEMQAVIDQYFEDCKGEPIIGDDGQPILDKYGQPFIINAHPPTVTGLALALGFTSRQALLNYQAKKAFVDTVLRAKARIEAYAEERLFDRDGQRGAEFSLKYNFRWADEKKQDEDEGHGVAELPAVLPAPPPPEAGGADG